MFSSEALDTKGMPVENIRVEPKKPAYVPSQQEIMVDTMQKRHIPSHRITNEYVYENNYYIRPGYGYVSPYHQYWRYREVPDRTLVGNDSLTMFFMGSITVVGLYTLFRMMNKK